MLKLALENLAFRNILFHLHIQCICPGSKNTQNIMIVRLYLQTNTFDFEYLLLCLLCIVKIKQALGQIPEGPNVTEQGNEYSLNTERI